MIPSNDKVGRQASLVGRTQAPDPQNFFEQRLASNSNNSEAGTVIADLIWEILIKHI